MPNPFVKGSQSAREIGSIGGKTRVENERKKTERLLGLSALREYLKTDGAEEVVAEMKKLEGSAKIQAVSSILEYFVPKMSRIETKNEHSHTVNIHGIFAALDKKEENDEKF